ncbi:hypothetical protein [Vibrio crassostreae]|uniref:hypothetical protein n=1 Tax=Vibrio crassostreae TaxID=246167 RepID=UPI001B301DB0|nr:hypothetical protein [Vibrio crassostreae]
MTKEFNNVIIQDISSRFGAEIAERFKGKEILESIKSFYTTEDNYLKHTKGVSLDSPDISEMSNGGTLKIKDITNQIIDSLKESKPLLFVIGEGEESQVVEALINSLKDTLGDHGEQVGVVKAHDFASATSKIKAFADEMHVEDDDSYNIVNIGVGFNAGFMNRFVNRRSINAAKAVTSFIDKGEIEDEKNSLQSLSTSFDEGYQLGLTQVMSSALIDAANKLKDDEYLKDLSLSTFAQHAKRLAELGNQKASTPTPLAFRTDDREMLSTYTSLSGGFQYFDSLDWTRQFQNTEVDAVLNPALTESKVNKVEFKELVDSINEGNLMAGVLMSVYRKGRQLATERAIDIDYEVTNQLNKMSKEEFAKLHATNNLAEMRADLFQLETKPHLSKLELQYLGRLKELTIDVRVTNGKLKQLLRDSEFVMTQQVGAAKVAMMKDKLSDHIDAGYARGLVKAPLDGALLIASETPSPVKSVMAYSSPLTKHLATKELADKAKHLSVVQKEGVRFEVKSKDGANITSGDVSTMARAFGEISEKLAAKASDKEPPVIVAEPDTLGQALGIMSYMNAGHSSGIDTNIHFRIPKKHKLKVTLSSGREDYLTIDEIARSAEDFASIECTFKPENSGNYTGEKSIFISKEDIMDMHANVGKKRFYGPLKAAFSTKGTYGNLHVKGYDPNFTIRYKKDLLLKPSKEKTNLVDDSFWREMKRRGYVQRGIGEKNMMRVNGVHINAENNFKTFKNTVLQAVDSMNGSPELGGKVAYWNMDTETTGLKDSDELINFGASAYTVVPNSGFEVSEESIFTTLSGEVVHIKDTEKLDLLKESELANHSASSIVQLSSGAFAIVDDATKIDNHAKLPNGNLIVNRLITQDYMSILTKDIFAKNVPNAIEELTGISADQVKKYGVSMNEIERLFEREVNRFEKNCFTFHNSDFDTNVIANHSTKMADLMTAGGNFVGDTIRLTRENNPNVTSEDLYTIKYGKRISVQIGNKEEVIDFLQNAQAGDVLECAKGSLTLVEDKGTLKLRLLNGKTGIYHKDFDANARDAESLSKLFELGAKPIYPQVKVKDRNFMSFENRNALAKFIESGGNGQKIRAIGGGYLEIHEGDIYAYHNGVSTNARKIASVGASYDSLVTSKEVSRFQSDMNSLVGLQKMKDIFEVSFPTVLPSNEEILTHVTDENKVANAIRFVNGFDLSKTNFENISNFQKVFGEESLEGVSAEDLGKSMRQGNQAKIVAYQNMDAMRAVAPKIEKLGFSKETVEKVSAEMGVDKRIVGVCAKAMVTAKQKVGLKNLFLGQSHNNGPRFNSDAAIELPVATNAVYDKIKNSYAPKASVENFISKLGDVSIEATRTASAVLNKNIIVKRGNEQAMGLYKPNGVYRTLGRLNAEIVDLTSKSGNLEMIMMKEKGLVGLKDVKAMREIGGALVGAAKIKVGKTGKDYAENFEEGSVMKDRIDETIKTLESKMDDKRIQSVDFAEKVFEDSIIESNVIKAISGDDIDLSKHQTLEVDLEGVKESYAHQVDTVRSAIAFIDPEKRKVIEANLDALMEGVATLETGDAPALTTVSRISMEESMGGITPFELGQLNKILVEELNKDYGTSLQVKNDFVANLAMSLETPVKKEKQKVSQGTTNKMTI